MDIPHIPGYELHEEIGGSSTIRHFAARHRAGGFACIVKTPIAKAIAERIAIQSIIREAQVGLAARNRHIVKMLDAQIHERPFFVVLEPLTGDSLADRLFDDPLEFGTAVDVARQVAEGLAAIHRLGYVHANLHLASIVMREDGTAVLTELGQAHRPGEEALPSEALTYHMAPELFDSGQHTFASDWFSYGLILSELLGCDSLGFLSQDRDILPFCNNLDATRRLPRQPRRWAPRLIALGARLTSPYPDERPTAAVVINELSQLAANDLRLLQAA